MHKQQGFTLIELVVVIVILGILAATALPKFVDMSAEAANGAAKGVAGALSSATSMNYGVRVASGGVRGVPIKQGEACSSLDALMQGGLSSDGKVAWVSGVATFPAACNTAGSFDSVTCKVRHADGNVDVPVTVVCTG